VDLYVIGPVMRFAKLGLPTACTNILYVALGIAKPHKFSEELPVARSDRSIRF
jgi:hypothetical protein